MAPREKQVSAFENTEVPKKPQREGLKTIGRQNERKWTSWEGAGQNWTERETTFEQAFKRLNSF